MAEPSALMLTPEGGTVTSDEANEINDGGEMQIGSAAPDGPRASIVRSLAVRLRRHGRIMRALGLVAVALLIGVAYVVGSPPATNDHAVLDSAGAQREAAVAPVAPDAQSITKSTLGSGTGSIGFSQNATDQSGTPAQNPALAAAETTQIVKTGQIDLEVTNLDTALGQARAAIAGLGGTVDSSNQAGTGDSASASITFRVPVAKWDDALAGLHKVASRVISEQTSSTDVTTQAIDLDARIDNLQKTEAALQSIMTRATLISDVLAVENQLSDTQSQIEQLTAQRDHLKGQAAMSTLTATFQLPGQTVTAKTTQDWTLGNQIDEAGAALVRIGQGLATIAVWAVVVVLPLGFAALVLFGLALLFRRITGRGRKFSAAAGA